jgi:hypothetical protein
MPYYVRTHNSATLKFITAKKIKAPFREPFKARHRIEDQNSTYVQFETCVQTRDCVKSISQKCAEKQKTPSGLVVLVLQIMKQVTPESQTECVILHMIL